MSTLTTTIQNCSLKPPTNRGVQPLALVHPLSVPLLAFSLIWWLLCISQYNTAILTHRTQQNPTEVNSIFYHPHNHPNNHPKNTQHVASKKPPSGDQTTTLCPPSFYSHSTRPP